MVLGANSHLPRACSLALGWVWVRWGPSTGYPGEEAFCSLGQLLKEGQAHRRAGSAWEWAVKAAAASWEGQPLCGQARVWEVVGRRALPP